LISTDAHSSTSQKSTSDYARFFGIYTCGAIRYYMFHKNNNTMTIRQTVRSDDDNSLMQWNMPNNLYLWNDG
jgi:hypothetical protein